MVPVLLGLSVIVATVFNILIPVLRPVLAFRVLVGSGWPQTAVVFGETVLVVSEGLAVGMKCDAVRASVRFPGGTVIPNGSESAGVKG